MPKRTIVLPETEDARIIQATKIILEYSYANIILIGNKENIQKKFQDVILDKAIFMEAETFDDIDILIDKFWILGPRDVHSREDAKRILCEDKIFFATMLVKEGYADGVVAGATHYSEEILYAAITIFKMNRKSESIFTYFAMDFSDTSMKKSTLIFSDCAINEHHDKNELVYIAKHCSEVLSLIIEDEPIVEFLPSLEVNNMEYSNEERINNAIHIFQNKYPHIRINGVSDLDFVKLDMKDSTQKELDSNVLIFPSIMSGNIGYKLVQTIAKAYAYGAIIVGLNKPICDLSRGCTVKDIVGSVLVLCIETVIDNEIIWRR